METDFSPMVRRLRVARELKELREGRKVTLQQAGDQLGWSRGRVSRLERAEIKPEPGMVMDLLDLYEVTGDRFHELVTLARQACRDGWWSRHGMASEFQRSYAELEAGARSLHIFQPLCVPGLLQTSDFAETRIRAGQPFQTEALDVAATVKLRLQRQEFLNKVDVHIVLDEAVLHRRLSSPQVRYDQMKHLIDQAERERVTLQVLPFDRHTDDEVAATSPFTIFQYPPPDPPMVTVDLTFGGLHQEVDDEPVRNYQVLYDRMADAALSPEKSAAMIEGLLNDI